MAFFGCYLGTQVQFCELEYCVGNSLLLEALWVCVAVCSGAEGSFSVWEEESTL